MPSKKSARLRVVIDTNVLISGIFFTGPPYWILKEWREGAFRIVVSQEIMEEYERVAQEISSRFPSVDIGDVLELIALGAELVDTTSVDVKVCRDPADDKFIACAIAGEELESSLVETSTCWRFRAIGASPYLGPEPFGKSI